MIFVFFCTAKHTSIATCVYSNMAQMPIYQAPRGYPPPPWKPRGTKVLSRSLNTAALYILYLSACSSSYSDYIVFFTAPQGRNKNFIRPHEKKYRFSTLQGFNFRYNNHTKKRRQQICRHNCERSSIKPIYKYNIFNIVTCQ